MILPKLHIDLVPQSCFFTNVRSQVSKEDWDILRRAAYKQAGHRCQICGAAGRMEAHEIWHYDDKRLVQKLFGLVCVCNACHQLYHLGFASSQGKLPQAMRRLAKINQWSETETKHYVDAVFEIWYQRSRKKWKLDLSLLDRCDIKYSLINSKDRIKVSRETLKNIDKN